MNFIFLTTMLILLFSLVSTSMANSLKTTAAISIALQRKTENVLKLENLKVDKEFERIRHKSTARKKMPLITTNYVRQRGKISLLILENLLAKIRNSIYFLLQQISIIKFKKIYSQKP